MTRYKLVCSLGFGDVFGQVVVWLILSVVTLGFALPFFGYFFLRLIINHTEVHQVA